MVWGFVGIPWDSLRFLGIQDLGCRLTARVWESGRVHGRARSCIFFHEFILFAFHLLGSPAKTAACTPTCASTIFRGGYPLIGRLITRWEDVLIAVNNEIEQLDRPSACCLMGNHHQLRITRGRQTSPEVLGEDREVLWLFAPAWQIPPVRTTRVNGRNQ